jgi:cytochrome c553
MRTLLILVLSGLSGMAFAAGDATAGQAKSQACGACHGPDGIAVAPAFPNLAGQNEKYLLRQLKMIKSKTRDVPTMAGQLDAMSDVDLAKLAAYFAAKPAKVAKAPDDAGALHTGEHLYRGGSLPKQIAACSACHSPMGNGNPPAGFPLLRGQSLDYVVAQLTAYREGKRKTDEEYGGMMRGVAGRLTDNEIRAVASYVQGLTPGQ